MGRITGVLIALALGLLLPSAAHAAFPGENGKIAFSRTYPFVNTSELFVNSDGSNTEFIAGNRALNVSWSPDGSKIAFTSDRDGNLEVYTMNADGTAQTNVTNNPAADVIHDWSPDGTKIALSTDRDGNRQIYTMNPDGSAPTRISQNTANDDGPAWSPDGTKFAFDSDRDGNQEIYVMNADGSGSTRLTNHPQADARPDWSPDGTKIAFQTLRSERGWDVYTMNRDGSAQTAATNNFNFIDDLRPAWAPDGTKIAFATTRDGNSEIYTMNPDGSAPTRVTNTSAHSSGPDWQPILKGYPRPKGAGTFHAPLVPAYQPCASPNRVHAPPLSYNSCNPPSRFSTDLTLVPPTPTARPPTRTPHFASA